MEFQIPTTGWIWGNGWQESAGKTGNVRKTENTESSGIGIENMKKRVRMLGMPLSLVLLAHQVQVNPLLPIDSQELIVIREKQLVL